ncbi:Spy/CpxP family protein refolding chaperone [Bradyrhizobium sp. 2TAF24]|uniref:Spy/CpxP family protein refolding chaperone n=1 Tax=Bradyrhizobium sp. 2TAF24 TaxID=3233011 RepID=UPI003F8DE693
MLTSTRLSSPCLVSRLVSCALAAALATALLAWPADAAWRGGPGGGFHGGGGGFHGGGFHGGGMPHGSGFHPGGGFHPGIAHFGGPHGVQHVGTAGVGGPHSFAIRSVHAPRGVNAPRGVYGRRFYAGRAAHARAGGSRAAMLNIRAAHMRWSAASVHGALQARPIHHALHSGGALRDPRTRAMIAASLATAAWHHGGHGWWRHRNGGYGWIGPLFWPFAYDDIYDYALWGGVYDDSFWGYGYPDLYAGLFAPYAYDDLTGYAAYLPHARRAPGSTDPAAADDQASLSRLCGEDSSDIAGLPIEQIRGALQPDDAQGTALDALAAASAQAAQGLKAACPADIALTAPQRLAIMQQRIAAMIAAVRTVQPPLAAFYGKLSDEQKAKLNGLAAASERLAARRAPTTVGSTGSAAPKVCAAATPEAGLTAWPGAAIEATVKPTEAQRRGFEALQAATAQAADLLRAAACADDTAVTPPARLATIGRRLDAMLQAVTTVRAPLDAVYATLSDEQKANFDTIGDSLGSPRIMTTASLPDQASEPHDGARHRHRVHHPRHGVRVERMLRHMLFSFVR